jgi:hypothetical protein
MVCLRNICINTLHKGDSIFTYNNNNNNDIILKYLFLEIILRENIWRIKFFWIFRFSWKLGLVDWFTVTDVSKDSYSRRSVASQKTWIFNRSAVRAPFLPLNWIVWHVCQLFLNHGYLVGGIKPRISRFDVYRAPYVQIVVLLLMIICNLVLFCPALWYQVRICRSQSESS